MTRVTRLSGAATCLEKGCAICTKLWALHVNTSKQSKDKMNYLDLSVTVASGVLLPYQDDRHEPLRGIWYIMSDAAPGGGGVTLRRQKLYPSTSTLLLQVAPSDGKIP